MAAGPAGLLTGLSRYRAVPNGVTNTDQVGAHWLSALPTCRPCQEGKSTKTASSLWLCERTPKIAQFVEITSIALCKQNVYIHIHRGAVDNCGKLLWTNLWGMWKTMSYQQLFRPCVFHRGCEQLCIGRCINPVSAGRRLKLRQPEPPENIGAKSGRWYYFVVDFPL